MGDDDSAKRSAMTPQGMPLTEGQIEILVRYCECDPMRVAHHASYIAWLEMGRTELLRPSGVSYREMEEAGVFLAVTRLVVNYKAPAMYDDTLLLRTRVSGGGRARIDHAYQLFRRREDGTAGDLIATAESTLACIDATGRPRALPEWLATKRDRSAKSAAAAT
ncbi:MAG: thioesterase family protein [Planctomycetota bacterium]|nr:thioesterase family protein [Planctomycetota bacterium]